MVDVTNVGNTNPLGRQTANPVSKDTDNKEGTSGVSTDSQKVDSGNSGASPVKAPEPTGGTTEEDNTTQTNDLKSGQTNDQPANPTNEKGKGTQFDLTV